MDQVSRIDLKVATDNLTVGNLEAEARRVVERARQLGAPNEARIVWEPGPDRWGGSDRIDVPLPPRPHDASVAWVEIRVPEEPLVSEWPL